MMTATNGSNQSAATTGQPNRPTPRTLLRSCCAAVLTAAVAVSGCHDRDEAEFDADSGGIPVTVTVSYHEGVFRALEPQGAYTPVIVRERRVIREPVYYPGYVVYTSRVVWEEHQPHIRAYLLAGDSPSDESLWYWPLKPGVQTSTVAIRPGHRLTLTLRAEGGERGEMVLGFVTPTATPGQQIAINIDRRGVHILASGAENSIPALPPQPPSGTPPPPPPSQPPAGAGSVPPPPPPSQPPAGATTAPPPPPPQGAPESSTPPPPPPAPK